MLPIVEDEVKRFYSELSLKEPIVRNPFIHRVQISGWQKKFEVREGGSQICCVYFLDHVMTVSHLFCLKKDGCRRLFSCNEVYANI